jgi:hypothetical protein
MERRSVCHAMAVLGVATALGVTSSAAQGVDGQVGRFYEDGGWDVYRLGVSRPIGGMFGLGLHGNYLRRSDGGDGGFAGLSADLTAFKGGGQGPYLVAGVGGGMGSPQSGDFSSVWGSWSAGAGYEIFPASFLAFGAEARWRELSLDHRDGLEVAAGLSIRFGGSGRPRPPQPVPGPSQPLAEGPPSSPGGADGVEGKPVLLRDSVIATATDAMGRPYRWGGTGANGGGFDCSGLIQHAYGQHGITLPRTSAEQAKQGKAVSRKLGSLVPGDLLTFSNRGGPVSHVGLYIGERRFIHSASRGVQISVLSGEDPYGRWWFKRWVGVRRIIDD